MIRIKKPPAPKGLATSGAKETEKLMEAYDADSAAFDSGAKNFEFKSSIYGSKAVKEALIRAQFGKCFACETNVVAGSHGDVEHFRPKGGYLQNPDDALEKPGYYWLAYKWDNLFLSCQKCNQTHKGNNFPLRKPTRRCRNHHGKLTTEEPLFLDPVKDDPREHIEFVYEVARARNGSLRGDKMIDGVGLWRNPLQDARLKILVLAKGNLDAALDEATPAHQRKKALDRLNTMRKADYEYSAMIDDMLKAEGI